jgi:hypothetical protein
MSELVISEIEDGQDSRFDISEDFDGLKTFQEIRDLMPPVGSVDKIVLDFSRVSNVKPIEVYALLAEMAAVSRFKELKISIEGLQFDKVYSDDFLESAQALGILPVQDS